MTKDEAWKLVRGQLVRHIEEELRSGESLMKEVYEKCRTPEDEALVANALRNILCLLGET